MSELSYKQRERILRDVILGVALKPGASPDAQQWRHECEQDVRKSLAAGIMPELPFDPTHDDEDDGSISMDTDPPMELATYHAKAGYTVAAPLMLDGKPYKGGQFIPPSAMAYATEEERQGVEELETHQLTREQYIEAQGKTAQSQATLKRWHEGHVRKALKAGQQVPSHVMEQYPSLGKVKAKVAPPEDDWISKLPPAVEEPAATSPAATPAVAPEPPSQFAEIEKSIRDHFAAGGKPSDELLDAIHSFPRKLVNQFVEREGLKWTPADEGYDVNKLFEKYGPKETSEKPGVGAAPKEAKEEEPDTPHVAGEPVGGQPHIQSEHARHLALADSLTDQLKDGGQVTAASLWKAADEAYGGTRADGKYGPTDAYDALEAAFNRTLKGRTDPSADLDDATRQAEQIADRVQQLPTQTNRSGNKDAMQQFSTPPHYSYAAAWLANVGPHDVVLEPSAGTGSLAVHAANAGAQVYVNELDHRRAAFLKEDFGHGNVHVENAEQIAGILPKKGVPTPTTVLMNPPFSATAGRMGDKKELMTGARHIHEAATMLAPGGRLVSIVGRGMTPESPTYKEWFRKMEAKGFTLRANVGMQGKEYKKYGTQFDTRVLIFDKSPTPPQPGFTGQTTDSLGRVYNWKDGKRLRSEPPVTGDAEDVPDLMKKLEGVRNDRATSPQSPRDAMGGQGAGAPQSPAQPPTDASVPTGAAPLGDAAAEPEGVHGGTEGTRTGTADDAAGGPTGGVGGGGLRQPSEGTGPTTGPGVGDSEGPSGPTAEDAEASTLRRSGRSGGGGGGGRRAAGGKSVQQSADFVSSLRPAERIALEAVASPEVAPEPAEKRPGQEAASLYEPYRPARLRVPGALRHPTSLVESSAMAAVAPPVPTYAPHLSPDVIERGMLTEPALESIVYAGQAHQRFLPAAAGDVQPGESFRSPTGESHALIVLRGGGLGDVKFGETWGLGEHTFKSSEEVSKFLVANRWTKDDGSAIKTNIAFRRGYFIGDGTGAGKGRQIAGIMADNWNQGKKKHVWVSMKQNLLEDAGRDWRDIGMDPKQLFHFDKIRNSVTPPKEGVAFITYDTLKSKPKAKTGEPVPPTNLESLAKWLGPDFDGVIAFDEAHAMGNALDSDGPRGGKKASARAVAGTELQKALPNARIVYVSATGATEVSNLAYADRLGIWGRGTPFAEKQNFIDQMQKGGVAAMEAVAQSLKATGSYGARSLSFGQDLPDGDPQKVTYDRITHKLTEDQHAVYDAAADAWQTVLQNIDKALEATGGGDDPGAKSAARSAFWGAQQRFFNQVMTSMQTPTVIRGMEDDLAGITRNADGTTTKGAARSPVIQLVNTMEAATKRAAARRKDEGEGDNLEDMDVSPREVLMQYLEKSFPVNRFEHFVDENGNESTRMVEDAQGNPVEDPEAVAMRDALLEKVGALRIPESPLDMIANHFGHENVAEATGRTQRIINQEQEDGTRKRVLEKRNTVNANSAEAADFQSGKKKIMVFSDAGGTGRSYHADKNAQNQDQRVHYMLQPGWRADNAVQGLGRTHRTNQVVAPTYRLVEIEDLKAQKRFISTIARRLDQLGALTRGQRQTGGGGLFSAADNLEGREADVSLMQFFNELRANKVEGLNYEETMKQLGFKTEDEDKNKKTGGRSRQSEVPVPKMSQFLNRLLSLRVDMQTKVFDAFDQRLKNNMDKAVREGTLDVGVENFKADHIDRKNEETVWRDADSGAEVKHLVVNAKTKTDKQDWRQLQIDAKSRGILGYYRNKRSGQIWAALKSFDETDAKTGEVVPQYLLLGPGSRQWKPALEVTGQTGGFEEIHEPEAKSLWDDEYKALPEFREREEHFVTGAFLPVWDKIPGAFPKIYRVRTEDGKATVGRYVARKNVPLMLKSLGHSTAAKKYKPANVHKALAEGDASSATLANGWKLKSVRVQGERRIELLGGVESGLTSFIPLLKQDGVTAERINYQTRFFIPVGEAGAGVLDRVTADRPVIEVEGDVEMATAGDVGLISRISAAAKDADANPTEGQKAAGNHRKGHVVIQGLPITIEVAKGGTRRGKSADGKEWSTKMSHHYGYIKRTESEADGDHVDVFIGPDPDSEVVFVVDQCKPGGKFDEHKCMIGFKNEAAARKGYLDCYSADWKGLKGVAAMTMEQFKLWLEKGNTAKPAAGVSMSTDTDPVAEGIALWREIMPDRLKGLLE